LEIVESCILNIAQLQAQAHFIIEWKGSTLLDCGPTAECACV